MKKQSSENSVVPQKARDLYQQTMSFGISRNEALETMSTGLAIAMTTVMNPQRDKFFSDHSSLLAHLDDDQTAVVEGAFTELISTGHRMYWTEKVKIKDKTYSNFIKLGGPRFIDYLRSEYARYFGKNKLLESIFPPHILSASDLFGSTIINAVSSQHEDIIQTLVGGDSKQFAKLIADLKQTAASLVFSGYVLSHIQDEFIDSLGVERNNFVTDSELNTDDDLYEGVKEFARTLKAVSTSLLQKKYGIGYARASKMMNKLEEDGFIESTDGTSRPRRVL